MKQLDMNNYSVVGYEGWNADKDGNLLTGFCYDLTMRADAEFPVWNEIRMDADGNVYAYSAKPALKTTYWDSPFASKWMSKVTIQVKWQDFGIIRIKK